MGIGYCGYAKKMIEDKKTVIYSYCCYNLSQSNWKEMKEKWDGEICLSRGSFIELEIHERIKRTPSGKKKLNIKRIPRNVWPGGLAKEGKLTVKNASGTWKTNDDGIDFMAFRLVMKLITEYQLSGLIPQCTSWCS
ncbi:MAG: hypothetical protein IJJ30_00220 [Erysipelotrichaceae bacterium]|nr:hypothetical protein [Erysipelotrichaceae bacterium]